MRTQNLKYDPFNFLSIHMSVKCLVKVIYSSLILSNDVRKGNFRLIFSHCSALPIGSVTQK